MTDKERFNGRCPYTDKPCEDWNCLTCEVDEREREWLREEECKGCEWNYNGSCTFDGEKPCDVEQETENEHYNKWNGNA